MKQYFFVSMTLDDKEVDLVAYIRHKYLENLAIGINFLFIEFTASTPPYEINMRF